MDVKPDPIVKPAEPAKELTEEQNVRSQGTYFYLIEKGNAQTKEKETSREQEKKMV